ncbi:MAG: haloacid dehalogenase-like hydrolase [Anaerolineales bacterium]|nr:haloacid dehalogenase-like hydrolase [Anaerolineales bacterium]
MIVVSDLMGTLTTGSPVLGLVDWVRHNQSKWQANLYMAGMLPSYFLAKNGLINWQKWGQGLMIDSLALLKEVTPEKFDEVAEWVVEKDLWKKRREDVIARLQDHAKNGAQVYLASSVHQPGVEAFAKRIGVQAIGTPVEFVDGRVRMATDLVASEKKIEQVLSRLGVERVDFAYGDSALDIPLLEHAYHPVAVYPEDKLRAVARERGWEIIGETASYP